MMRVASLSAGKLDNGAEGRSSTRGSAVSDGQGAYERAGSNGDACSGLDVVTCVDRDARDVLCARRCCIRKLETKLLKVHTLVS